MKLYILVTLYISLAVATDALFGALMKNTDFGALIKSQKLSPTQAIAASTKSKEEKTFLDSIKARVSGVKAKVAGETPFAPKDKLFDELLDTFAGFQVMTDRVQLVKNAANLFAKMEGNGANKPVLRTDAHDYASIRVLAAARATGKKNMALQVAHLVADLSEFVHDEGRRARALWKYLALCAIKLTPIQKWRNKSLQELFKPAEKFMKRSGREDWFKVPITKSHVLFDLGKGKLPWSVEPRTASDLLNGILALMATSGRFKRLTSIKAITLGWEKACKRKNLVYKEAIKNLLNLQYVNAASLDNTALGLFRSPIVREMMTLYAVNLEILIKKGEKEFASAVVNVPKPRNYQG